MNITEGLIVNDKDVINWNISFDELILICKNNKIKVQYDKIKVQYGKIKELKKVSIPINFANLGMLKAHIYFENNIIRDISFTSLSEESFNFEKYMEINKKLLLYFGKPTFTNKNKTVWNCGKVKIKHYFIKRDDIFTEYLKLDVNS